MDRHQARLHARYQRGIHHEIRKTYPKTGNSGLEDLFAASGPNVISFAGGYPDRSLFPTQQLNQAFKH
ncbi:aminotransferase, partial [Lacticaseibacillus rhamnosus MTCC 5462]